MPAVYNVNPNGEFLRFEPPRVTVIRKSYIGEATLSRSAETGPISLHL